MTRRRIKPTVEREVYDARSHHAQCDVCPLGVRGCLPVRPRGESGRLVVVNDYPDAYSDKLGHHVPTAASKLTDKVLTDVGASEVYNTTALLCRPPKEATNAEIKSALQCCKPRVEAELSAVRSSQAHGGGEHVWAVAAGPLAFEQLSGRTNFDAYLGSPVACDAGLSVIPVQDPGFILSKGGTRFAGRWHKYLERAASFANGSLEPFEWPESVVEGETLSEALEEIAKVALAGGEVSVDLETRGLGLDSSISCIGLATASRVACVQLPLSERDERSIRTILANGVQIGQNLSAFDRQVLKRAGYELTPEYHDTLLAASILDPQLPKHLGALVSGEFHAEAHKANFKADKESGVMSGMWDSTDPAVERDRRIYCLRDAYTTLLVWRVQRERLREYGWELYQNLKRLDRIALRMRETGIYWNFDAAAKMKEEYDAKIEKELGHVKKAAAVLGLPDFNFQSPKQLRDLYFSRFRVPPVRWSETGQPSVDGDALNEYIKSDNPVCSEFSKKLMGLRTLWKMRAVYIEGCAPETGEKFTKGTWRASTAISGRWSCTGKPLQTVPTEMRELFCAEPGKVLMEADVAALEARSIALFAGAKTLLQMLENGEDIHLYNAENIFKRKLEKKSRERQLAKLVFFASAYRAAPATVWQQLVSDFPDITERQIVAVQNALWKIHPEIPQWWDEELKACAERGFYHEPISDRRVYFYGSPEPSLSVNMPNQSLGAYLINTALLKIWDELDQETETVISQIHDSICLSGPDGERLLALAYKHMVSDVEYKGRKVRIEIEAKTGTSYRLVK